MTEFPRVWLGASLLLGVLAGGAGCGAAEPADVADEVAQAPRVEAAADADRDASRRDGRGHGMLLRAALDELDLTEAQRTTIEGALAKLPQHPKGGPEKGAEAFAALAQGVRSGKIDEAAVLAKLGGEAGPTEADRAALADAVKTLHVTLTKEQRRALVDRIEARMSEHGDKGKRDGKWGHEGKAGKRGGKIAHLLRGIELTSDQQARVEQALAAAIPPVDHQAKKQEKEAKRAAMRAKLETFTTDGFDAKAFVTPPADAGGHGPKAHFERMVKGLAAVLPILDAGQRAELADRLEKGPRFGKGERGKRPHGDRRGGAHGRERSRSGG